MTVAFTKTETTLFNALLHFSIKHKVEFEQKYLVAGHTQMECDSVHALIECRLKDKDVCIPYEFIKYTKKARESFPYDAEYVHMPYSMHT